MPRLTLAAAIVALASGGCSSGNVALGSAIEQAPAPNPSEAPVLRLYFDRDGDLYPGPLLDVDLSDDAMIGAGHPILSNVGLRYRLLCHFARERGEVPEECGEGGHPFSDEPRPWTSALGAFGIDGQGPTEDVWWQLQDSLASLATRAVHRATRRADGSERTLVLLVHGFNNNADGAEANYAAVRRAVEDHLPGNDAKVFLQVYWDGLVNDLGIPVWRKAQFNFPLVGLGLRRVLNTVSPEVPIRIVSHSSGGPLVANALWDGAAAISTGSSERIRLQRSAAVWPRYRDVYAPHRADTDGRWAIPFHPDIRVGMIVPAMPGITFDFLRAVPGGPSRIVIGVNENDVAINKFGVPTSRHFWRAPCRQSGSACLASIPSEYCGRVRPRLRDDPDTALYLIDFTSPRAARPELIGTNHAVTTYLRQPDAGRFLDLVFNEAPDDLGEEQAWCR